MLSGYLLLYPRFVAESRLETLIPAQLPCSSAQSEWDPYKRVENDASHTAEAEFTQTPQFGMLGVVTPLLEGPAQNQQTL